jgi:hypothetical protein
MEGGVLIQVLTLVRFSLRKGESNEFPQGTVYFFLPLVSLFLLSRFSLAGFHCLEMRNKTE